MPSVPAKYFSQFFPSIESVGNFLIGVAESYEWTKNVFASIYNVGLSFTSFYLPNEKDLQQVHKNRQAFWKKLEQDSGVELVNHLRAFCEYDPVRDVLELTRSSMFAGLKDLGFKPDGNKLIVAASEILPKLKGYPSAHFNFKDGLNTPFYPEDGPSFRHPFHTGLYRPNGTFDAQRFTEFNAYAVRGKNGNLVISREKFDECKAKLWSTDIEFKNAGLVETYVVGAIGSLGEIGAMFEALTTELIDGVPHASLEDIEVFYRNTAKSMADKTSVCDATTSLEPATCEEMHWGDRLLAPAIKFAKDVCDVTSEKYHTGMVIHGRPYSPTQFHRPVEVPRTNASICAPRPVAALPGVRY